METKDVFIPSREGSIMTAGGTELPREVVQGPMLLGHDFTNRLVDAAQALHDLMLGQKEEMWGIIDLYQRSLLAIYNAGRFGRAGGERGTMTITTMDQLRKVTVTTAKYESVTGSVMAAQALVNQVLEDITVDVNPNLRALVNNAFVRDEKTGNISVEKLKGLKGFELDHPLWPDAQRAIEDSIQTIGSRLQIRFYEREKSDLDWKQIPLQFSSL
ncbi:DUF3164 family protein [Acetobacter persici]|uniref:Sulfate transporter n=1 Tax=Acetobacter persici TaxID=1076596 RepID=A0A6V8ICN1_9PROT|nr:DUF3164 family protein [Acetobacter persici]OUI91381.1 hypothetical protein HK19_06135 [Acetobacter persici]GFE94842.1 hypothetical protein DmAi_29010 [Acetobacter persici]